MRSYTSPRDRDVERRAWPRRRTLLAAKLACGDPSIIVNCGVRNLSEQGARIELESAVYVQRPFRLLMMRDGVIHEAELVWSWGKVLGLSFTATHAAQAPVPDELKLLRVFWSATRV